MLNFTRINTGARLITILAEHLQMSFRISEFELHIYIQLIYRARVTPQRLGRCRTVIQYVLSKQPSCPQSTWNNEHIVLRADVNLLNLKSLTLQSICDLLTFIFTSIYPENGPLGEGLVRPPSIEESFWDFGKPNCPNYSNHQHVFLAFNALVMTKELAGWLFRMCMMKVHIMNRISAVLFGNWGQVMLRDLHP